MAQQENYSNYKYLHSLILTLCLAQREGDAVVRREDDKGVIVQVTSLQLRKDEPHTLVHSSRR